MLEEMNKENSQELLEQMEMTSESLEEQLDRNLELFKQLEFEMRMEESISELKKLAEEQKNLAEETKNSDKKEANELQQKQDSINNAFEAIKEELKELVLKLATECHEKEDNDFISLTITQTTINK